MVSAKEALTSRGPTAAHGHIVLADEQTAGVGRRGRPWVSQPRGNLYFSFVMADTESTDTAAFMANMLKLNFAIGVATVLACREVGLATARVKWPNDVWVGTQKISGMLVNVDASARAAIAGVGINVNQVLMA